MEVTSVWGTLWTSYKYLKEVNKHTDLGPAARDSVNDIWQLKLSSAFHFSISPEESKAAWSKRSREGKKCKLPTLPISSQTGREKIWSGCPRWLSGNESACHAGDTGLIPGFGRSPGEECWPMPAAGITVLIDLLSVLLRCNGLLW